MPSEFVRRANCIAPIRRSAVLARGAGCSLCDVVALPRQRAFAPVGNRSTTPLPAGAWVGVQKPVPGTKPSGGQRGTFGIPFHPGYLRLELFRLPTRDDVRALGVDGARLDVAVATPFLQVSSWYNSTVNGAGHYHFTFGNGVYSKLDIDLMNGTASFGTADGALRVATPTIQCPVAGHG